MLTDHSLQILEVLKDDGSLKGAKTLRVSQLGGKSVVDGREVVSEAGGFKTLATGEDFILFLSYWPAGSTYVIAYGPAGVSVS